MRRLITWQELEALKGKELEASDLDFKDSARDLTHLEAAKDIAALANTLGGFIIVGAQTDQGKTRCTDLQGIDAATEAGPARKLYEEAAAQRIRPSVQVAARQVDVPGTSRVVVIIDVPAAHAAPVGVQLPQPQGKPDEGQLARAEKVKRKLIAQGWVFPYRIGSQTEYFRPDQFSAFNDMTARRSAALLSSIPESEWGQVLIRGAGADEGYRSLEILPGRNWLLDATLEKIDLLRNVAVFRASEGLGHSPIPLRVPLDWVTTVWRDDRQNEWMVVTACRFVRGASQWEPSLE